ncbi:MAG: hypothetical protein J5621_08200, partial [Paludibacteraceae bacterium]|nr:hypothetical protein [Paludibacteraceae bacterium]
GMDKGHYLVSKHGYENGTGWFRIDDHTYPNDPDKGYFMEVDGAGSGSYFYKHTIGNIAPGSQLTFSAYVANVTTPSGYIHIKEAWKYLYPRLTFSIVNPHTSKEIARYATDTIGHDWTYYGQPDEYLHSPQWQHVGIRFTMPNDLDVVELRLINNVAQDNSSGNDFAIDDIEVRLCNLQVTIMATDTVCIDTKNTFTAEVKNGSSFLEPTEYQWYFSSDSIHWIPLVEANNRTYTIKTKLRHAGWYKVVVSGTEGINSDHFAAESEPFKLFVIEDCPPILCPEGILLFRDTQSGIGTPYHSTIDGLCAESDLSIIASVKNKANVNPRLLFVLKDSESGRDLGVFDTGEQPSDYEWHKVGMNLTVPEDVSSVSVNIKNNAVGVNDADIAIDSVEVRLCLEPISIASADTVCRKYPHILYADYDNLGILQSPEYQWSFSADSISWSVLQTGTTKSYDIPNVHKSNEGWYRVSVANTGNNDSVNCRSVSEPFRLQTTYCNTATNMYIDTTACDTLLPLSWRNHSWSIAGSFTDTIHDLIDMDDSVYVHLTLHSKICCPDLHAIRFDTAICDTMLPFLWIFRDTMLLYTDVSAQEIAIQHPKWENCVDSLYILALDTFHCEHLYPIIVNKYNWQLLLDYTALRRIFPDMMPAGFQWYKDGPSIPGANLDEYAERNELHGIFQLRVRMNNGQDIWSNIIEILDTKAPLPIIKRVYNSSGMPIDESQMTRGIYIIHYQQGDHIWAEKKIVL